MTTSNFFQTNIDEKLNALRNGGTLIVSKCNSITVTAEKSGKGDVVRFVRTYANGSWEVFRTSKA